MNKEFRRRIESLLPYVAPILVYPRIDPGFDGWITGGTALLARTETNRFLITADHVFVKIDELHEESDIVVLLGGIKTSPVDITLWRTLARDSVADIRTIQVPDDFVVGELNKAFFELDLPLRTRATAGDLALILGFPVEHRCASSSKINARVLPIMDYVTDVGGRRFTIADESNRREILINPDNLTFPTHLGGMSGSPVFRIDHATSPVLMGILSECGDGLRGAYFCSHANFLLPDGHFDIHALPPR